MAQENKRDPRPLPHVSLGHIFFNVVLEMESSLRVFSQQLIVGSFLTVILITHLFADTSPGKSLFIRRDPAYNMITGCPKAGATVIRCNLERNLIKVYFHCSASTGEIENYMAAPEIIRLSV